MTITESYNGSLLTTELQHAKHKCPELDLPTVRSDPQLKVTGVTFLLKFHFTASKMAVDWRYLGLGVVAAGLASAGLFYAGYRSGEYSAGRAAAAAAARTALRGKSFDRAACDPIGAYVLEHNRDENPALRKLRELSIDHKYGEMTTPIEEGNLLTMLVRALDAKKVIDVGVFTGCSAFSMALGLAEGGKVVACEISDEFTSLGRPYWEEGGVAEKIDLRLQPAAQTLQELIDNGEAGTFDLVFIDANKDQYPEYYQFGVTLLRVGGILVVDNALLDGHVVDPATRDERSGAIHRTNEAMSKDPRLRYALLNFSDGMGIAQKL